jgi:hypothetical protein
MPMFKRGCVVLFVILASACGGNSTPTTPTTPTPTRASLTISVVPSPITAVRCNPLCVGSSGTSYAYSFSMTLTIQETAGVSGNINQITFTPVSGGGPQSPLTYGPDVVIQRSGTNHIGPRGTLSFPEGILDSTVPLVVNITVAFGDDKGNQITGTAQVSVM